MLLLHALLAELLDLSRIVELLLDPVTLLAQHFVQVDPGRTRQPVDQRQVGPRRLLAEEHVGVRLGGERPLLVALAALLVVLGDVHPLWHPLDQVLDGLLQRVDLATEGAARLASALQGGRLQFRFSIPNDLPSSEPPKTKQNFIKWRLNIECDAIEPKFSRQFEVPVFATGKTASMAIEDAQQHPMVAKQQAEDALNALNIEFAPEGVIIKRGYWHNAKAISPILIFGLVFVAAGVFFLHVGAPAFLPVIFILIGFVATAGCLDSLLHEQKVAINAEGISIEKRYIGFLSSRRFIKRDKVHYLALKQSYSTQHEGKYKTFYKLQACLTLGKPVLITGSIAGEGAANYWLERISQHTGIAAQ